MWAGWVADTKSERISRVCALLPPFAPSCPTHQIDTMRATVVGLSKNAYIYLPVSPLVPVVVAFALKNKSTLKEWDTPLSESDKFSTTDLEPFESTSFCSLSPHASDHPSGGPAVPNSSEQGQSRSRRWSGSSSPSRPPAKRMRAAALDMGPLGEFIPLVLLDPSRAMLYMLTTIHSSPITSRRPLLSPPIFSHRHLPVRHLTLDLLLLCRFRHRLRLLSRPSSRRLMPALPG